MTRKHFSMLLAICMMLVAMPMAAMADYSDMPNDYSTEALKFAVDNGYLVGMDGKVMPDDSITVAQVAQILTRSANLTGMADMSGYSDINQDAWYYAAMGAALDKGMIMATGDMLYPDMPITREGAFKALAVAFEITGTDMSVLDGFTDKDMISSDAMEEVAALVEAGIVEGYDNMIVPKNEIRRKDFAVIMYRLMMDDAMNSVTFMSSVTHSFTGEEIAMTEMEYVKSGMAVSMPDDPENTVVINGIDIDKWYDLRAWYTEPELINKWDFDMPVTKDMTLYAEFVHIPDPPTNTHFSMINEMHEDSEGITIVKGIEDGHEYGPISLADGLVINTYMADMTDEDVGVYLAYTIGDRMIQNAVPVEPMMSGVVTYISEEGVMLDDGKMLMFDKEVYMYWGHEDGTYSVYNKVAGRFPVVEITAEHLPLGSYITVLDARSGSDLFAEGKIDAILVREPSDKMVYTMDELAMYNGKDGMPAYIAIDGIVYDASEHAKWMEGMHGGQMAGTDITEAFKNGHNDDRFESLPVVGMLVK